MTQAPTMIERYGLAPVLMEAMSDPASALRKLHLKLLGIRDQIESIVDPATSADGSKAENPLDVLYSKDDAGKNAALAFLRADGGILDQLVDYIGEDPGRTYHISNALGLVTKYLSDERAFFVSQMSEAKPVNRSQKQALKADFNELLSLFGNVAGMAVASGMKLSDCPEVTLGSNKSPRSILPGYKGTKSSDDGSVSGRYARIYSLTWNIDGDAIEDGARIASIVRLLWTGADRIGKNAKSLTDLLDAQAPKWTTTTMEPTTFTVNGHEVTVSREAD